MEFWESVGLLSGGPGAVPFLKTGDDEDDDEKANLNTHLGVNYGPDSFIHRIA